MNGNNKPVALITGASRGIGQAMAQKLARNNFKLALLSRSKDGLQSVAEQLDIEPDDYLILDTDVNDTNKLSKAIDNINTKFGCIDTVMVNHGIYAKSFFNSEPGNWREVLNTNLLSAMHLTELTLPYLTQSSSVYKSLFFTASVASHNRYAGGAAYCTSKHGLLGFAHCVFEEVRDTGLKVCAICPGFVNTDMIDGSRVELSKAIQPNDIANIVFNTMSLDSTVCPVEIIIRPQCSPYKT